MSVGSAISTVTSQMIYIGFSVHMEVQTLMVHVMCTIGTSNIYNEFWKRHQHCYLTNSIYVALPLQEGTESDGTYDV